MVRMGFSLTESHPSSLPASFKRTKVLPAQRLSQAAPHSAALQPQLPWLTMASFKATSALGKRDTAPATKNYNSLNLASGGRGGGECTGEREQRRKSILS